MIRVKRTSPGAPRGFASIFALFLVALVAAALLAVTSLMTTDARRSTREAVDAQLRQLLHAGSQAALQRLRDGGQAVESPFMVEVPTTSAASVDVLPHQSADEAVNTVIVRARFADREMRQRVSFERAGDSWRVRSVELP